MIQLFMLLLQKQCLRVHLKVLNSYMRRRILEFYKRASYKAFRCLVNKDT